MKNFTLSFLFLLICSEIFAQTTIEDARRNSEGTTVTVTGVVINGEELGDIRYIQDATGGIGIYDNNYASSMTRGDSVTVTGVLDEYNYLLEIKSLTSFTKHASNVTLPTPQVITIDQIGEDYEGELIRIDSVKITGATGTFGNKNYSFTDGTNTGELRINSNSELMGAVIPSEEFSLIAIGSQYSYTSSTSGYQLLPRDNDDFVSESNIKISSTVDLVEVTKNTISLAWSTDNGSIPYVRYGASNSEAALTNYKEGDATTSLDNNSYLVEITGLEPAEIIYAQVFNVSGTDTAYSSIQSFVTKSNSSGDIQVYFNSEVDETKATTTTAQYNKAMDDTLAAYINRANESIDFCIYNINNSTVTTALNNAYERGVKIRFITCGTTNHVSTQSLNDNIPVLERPKDSEGGLMHNKFAIFDANSSDADDVWVWSGSTNLTNDQLHSDINNMIFIQDQSLAKVYEIEFEEMWGSSSNQYNSDNSKFGDNKADNTPHEIYVGDTYVESYFSPSDNTNQKIIDVINTSDNDLEIETMLITRTTIAQAIVDASDSGVDVSVITDSNYNSDSQSVISMLNDVLSSDKYVFEDTDVLLHSKFAIVDAFETSSDPQVITGSHNWSSSADSRNDENTLVVHNADIANQYFQQFAACFNEYGGDITVSAGTISVADVNVYPNPTQDKIYISSSSELQKVELYSILGMLIKSEYPQSGNSATINLKLQKNGIYILKVEDCNGLANTYKVIKK